MSKKTPKRIKADILRVIKDNNGAATTSDIQATLQYKVRKHLRALEREGVVVSEKVGRPTFINPRHRGEDSLSARWAGLVHAQEHMPPKEQVKDGDVSLITTMLWRIKE